MLPVSNIKKKFLYVSILTLNFFLLFISSPQAAQYQIKQLTNNTYRDVLPQIHNGQVTWMGDINADYMSQIFLYDGKRTLQLTDSPYANYDPQIHNGQVVWWGWDGNDYEIFFYDGKQTVQLTNNDYMDRSPQINNGQIVWYGYDGDDSEIFFYDGRQTIKLTDNDYNDFNPQIDNGQIVWEATVNNTSQIFLYDGRQTIQLGSGISPQIHNGQVVWSGWDGNDMEIYFYDGSRIIQLSDNDYWDGDPQIDNGQVAWGTSRPIFFPDSTFVRGYAQDTFFYDGSRTIRLTPEQGATDYTIPQIHNGMVTWQASITYGIYNQEIFLYDGRQIIQLTNNKKADSFPQIHNGQVVWSGWDGNDMEIFLAWQPAFEILDGVDFSSGREVSSDPEKIVSLKGVEVKGAVTDGVTRLLLKLEVDEPNAVTFSLEGTGNPKEDGLLRSLDGSQEGSSITVNSVNTTIGEKAFAIYQSPENFVRENYPEDKQVSERTISLKVTYNGSSSFASSEEIKLVRPPIILIHGLWSGPEMWDSFSSSLRSKLPGLRIFTANYRATNASYLDINKKLVFDYISKAKEELRAEGIAMVQADIFGHSMGGLLARIYAGGDQWYEDVLYMRDDNFEAGDINKLITLDSPHFGSFIADLGIGLINNLEEEERNLLLELAKEKSFSLDEGAVEDLMTSSPKIIYMNEISTDDLASHAIIGDVSRGLDSLKDNGALLYIILTSIEYNTGDNILPNESDLVVSAKSQAGGLIPPTSSTFNHHHMDAVGEEVVNKAVELLNTAPDDSLFAPGFPVNKWPEF